MQVCLYDSGGQSCICKAPGNRKPVPRTVPFHGADFGANVPSVLTDRHYIYSLLCLFVCLPPSGLEEG